MEAFKSLINYLSNPTILFTAVLVGFPFVFPPTNWFYKAHKKLGIDKLWTKKGLLIMVVVTVAFFIFGLGDDNFKKMTITELTTEIGSTGLSYDGSTANGVLTYKDADEISVESNLTFDGTNLAVAGNLNVNQVSGNHGQLIVGGAISCVGNITAFTSDIRLKTEIQPIENAVAKLLKLNGFTYEHNELAESLGYERNGERFSGVSAQDVKEVLPEAVKPAPANADYMTVQYEKLVPLLIEAIKELKSEIDELKK